MAAMEMSRNSECQFCTGFTTLSITTAPASVPLRATWQISHEIRNDSKLTHVMNHDLLTEL
jgi:hypothetical protein